jgi:hypothetical protein
MLLSLSNHPPTSSFRLSRRFCPFGPSATARRLFPLDCLSAIAPSAAADWALNVPLLAAFYAVECFPKNPPPPFARHSLPPLIHLPAGTSVGLGPIPMLASCNGKRLAQPRPEIVPLAFAAAHRAPGSGNRPCGPGGMAVLSRAPHRQIHLFRHFCTDKIHNAFIAELRLNGPGPPSPIMNKINTCSIHLWCYIISVMTEITVNTQ